MRKKLHFDNTFNIGTPMYILIDSGKIREYEGADFMPLILHGHPQPEFKKFDLNSDFKLIKVSKYDRKKSNIKGNYKIDCHDLIKFFLKDSYIKLNMFEKFLIDYSKKDSILHKMNFTQKIIILLFITIPGAFIVTQLKSCESQEKSLKIKNDNQENNNVIFKTDTTSAKAIKIEHDSLLSK